MTDQRSVKPAKPRLLHSIGILLGLAATLPEPGAATLGGLGLLALLRRRRLNEAAWLVNGAVPQGARRKTG